MKDETSSEKPIEKLKKDWLKIIIFSLIEFFLLFGAFYAGYWYAIQTIQKPLVEAPKQKILTPTLTPNPVPLKSTADWEMYSDVVYHYSLRHPKDWYVSPTSGEGATAKITSYDREKLHEKLLKEGRTHPGPEDLPPEWFFLETGIVGVSLPPDQTIEKWAKGEGGWFGSPVESVTSITVDNIPAAKVLEEKLKETWAIIYIPKGKEIYFIESHFTPRYEPAFELIMKSFKFLD